MSKTSTTVKSHTDVARLKAMRDEDIDYSDTPKVTPEMFAKGVVKKGGVLVRRVKQPVTLRVEADVLEWFKARGKGYQTEMNAVLAAYVKAHQEKSIRTNLADRSTPRKLLPHTPSLPPKAGIYVLNAEKLQLMRRVTIAAKPIPEAAKTRIVFPETASSPTLRTPTAKKAAKPVIKKSSKASPKRPTTK